MDVQITVTGHAEERIAPELAAVNLFIGGSGPHRDGVVQRTSGAHQDLVAELRALDAAGVLDTWSAGQLRVWAHRPWNTEGRQLPLVHEARADVELVFRDLPRLGEWLGAAAEQELLTVTGIDWRLTEVTRRRVQATAQRRAVADAVEKARAYAEALGLARPTPVALADRGMLAPAGAGGAAPAVMMRAAAFGGSGGPTPDFTPADLVIEASVDARFSAEPA